MHRYFIAVLLVAGCTVGTRVRPVVPSARVEPTDSLALLAPVVDICFDGERLVLLEAGGERLVVLDPGFAYSETIALTERLVAPAGVTTDRFYFYIYDDKGLYRVTKDQLVMRSWLGNVRVSGLAGYSSGEMLVSDSDRDVVWYKTVFGESRKFLGLPDVKKPGPMLTLADGRFCVLCSGTELVWFNRAGIIDQRQQLGQPYGFLVADAVDRLLLASSEPVVRVSGVGTQTAFTLGGCSGVRALAVRGAELAVLDAGDRVLFYTLP